MKKLFVTVFLSLFVLEANAATLYTQMPLQITQPRALYQSSLWFPDGSDNDKYVYDSFTLPASAQITEIRWRGGYLFSTNSVDGFTVSIFGSTDSGQMIMTAPDSGPCTNCLAMYTVVGNAGETFLGGFGPNGTPLYNYTLILPAPFQAAAGSKYWVQIEARQSTVPDWGLAQGNKTVSDGHIEYWNGYSTFYSIAGETDFDLIGNIIPVAISQVVTLPENMTAVIVLSATDSDGNPLTYRVATPPLNGTLTGNAPNLIYTPAINFTGTDSFSFLANDGFIDSNVATVEISVAKAVRLGKFDFSLLQLAYNSALNGDEIKVQAVPLVENLLFNGAKAVKIKGGYDSGFNMPIVNGVTTLKGSVIIHSGSVYFDRIVIR